MNEETLKELKSKIEEDREVVRHIGFKIRDPEIRKKVFREMRDEGFLGAYYEVAPFREFIIQHLTYMIRMPRDYFFHDENEFYRRYNEKYGKKERGT